MSDRNSVVEEHPDDKAVRADSIRYAKEMGPAFCELYREEIEELITTYADARAETALDILRERFWTRDWEKKQRRSGK